jgi:hypothetical protein
MCNKTNEIVDYVKDRNIDVLAITETWLKETDEDNVQVVGDITADGFSFKHVARAGKKGGGVGLLFRKTLSVKCTPVKMKSFECMDACITSGGTSLRLLVVYRLHPKYKKNGINSNLFFDEFTDLVSKFVTFPGKLLIVGDFNIHWNKPNDPNTLKLNDILKNFELDQFVQKPTHTSGNILDLVLSRRDDSVVKCVRVSDLISDHAIIDIDLKIDKPGLPKKTVTYRKFRAINLDTLREDISQSDTVQSPANTLEDLVNQYDTSLRILIDKHAPQCTRAFTERPMFPWYNMDITNAKKWRRKCERLYRRSKLTVHKDMYREARLDLNKLIANAKLSYYNEKILDGCPDQKSLFKFMDKVCHKKQEILPDVAPESLVVSFNDYFVQKIGRIRSDLDNQLNNAPEMPSMADHDIEALTSFSVFQPMSQSAIEKIVSSSSGASCSIDPIPTWLLKECKQELIPVITKIVNMSMSSGIFPESMKKAMVRPLIKKPSLDPTDFKNYRPVSNLSFVSKVIEKSVAGQLKSYLLNSNIEEKFQSAYRAKHSTETAMLKIVNDIRCCIDKGQSVVLVLLDLSAAFDTVDYDILEERLSKSFGIKDVVLQWINSYLRSRKQSVTIMEAMSMLAELLYGVPQGSVLGPLLFVMYILPLGDIARRHGIMFHSYADDTQLYVAFDRDPVSMENAIHAIEACISDIKMWMLHNRLKMNDSKTEMLVLSSPNSVLSGIRVSVGDDTHESAGTVRNLGVVLDQTLSLNTHVSRICQSGYFQLRSLRTVQNVLPAKALERLAHAFITSRLDYCNSILFGLPENMIQRLQLLQNSAARMVSKVGRYDHIRPILKSLHWLPVKQRINFKVLVITYKALNDLAPSYIRELLKPYHPTRMLRSCDANLLTVPRMRLKTFGYRTFCYAAPHLWNDLPQFVRDSHSLDVFKTRLKTHLFNIAYQ